MDGYETELCELDGNIDEGMVNQGIIVNNSFIKAHGSLIPLRLLLKRFDHCISDTERRSLHIQDGI